MSVVTADGKKYIDLQADFTGDQYQMFYNAMVSELNVPLTTGNMQLLDYASYGKKSTHENVIQLYYFAGRGRFFFTIDCSRNHAADIHDSVPIISKRELNLEFTNKLEDDLVLVLMYFETRGHTIDGYRNVTVHSYN